MFRKKYFLFIFSLFIFIDCSAQPGDLPVNISLYKNTAGDSLWLNVSINSYTRPSSLMLIASLENAEVRDTFFIPVIDSMTQYCFVFPDSINDNLFLQTFFFPGIFRISGEVNRLKKSSPVEAIFITANNRIYNKTISFSEDNKFILPAIVFEKQASLAFNYADTKKSKSHPDISIKLSPTAADFKELVYSTKIKRLNDTAAGKTLTTLLSESTGKVRNRDSKFKTLKNVEVIGIKKSEIQKFNEAYSTGLFNNTSERVIDCLNNTDILSYPNCINYLQGRIPGLIINNNKNGEMGITWRGKEVRSFFIDEIAVDIQQILFTNTAEIAMLKVYPPPFFGSLNGDGGAIALYTRKGEYIRPGTMNTQWLFTIKGYASQVNVLFEK